MVTLVIGLKKLPTKVSSVWHSQTRPLYWLLLEANNNMVKVQIGEVKRFMAECLKAAGARVQPATEQAELLTYADVIGHRSCGMKKLCSYVNDIKNGVCKPNNEPLILKEKTSTAWVDAKDVMGATAGSFAMDLAIKKAIETGVGWVAIKGSHHNAEPYSYWSQKAADNGLIGMVFSNTSSIQQPPDTKRKVERKAQDTQPKKIVIKKIGSSQNRRITGGKRDLELNFTSVKPPVGKVAAPELAAMVGLSRATPSDTRDSQVLKSWLSEPLAQNLGQCFVAVNPACFALGFDGNLSQTIPLWKQMDLVNPKLLEVPLRELEKKVASEFREADMLNYELQQINAIVELAVKLNVKPMRLHESDEKLH